MGPTRILGRLRHRGATSRIAGTIRRLFRRPPLYWTAVTVIALTTGAMVWASLRSADRGAAVYGAPREVLVAARDLTAGTRIQPTDVVRQRIPSSGLPPAAIDELPSEAVVAVAIDSGEVLTSRRLGRRGASPSSLRVEAGRRGVAVPRGTDALPLRVGDHVDVAVVDVDAGADQSASMVALRAERAPVISVDARVTVVSVEEKVAAELAIAAADGRAQLVLVGADDRDGRGT